MWTWDFVARWYDWQLWLERSAVRAAVDLAAARPGARVLDVGTGTGAALRELARRGARPAWVLGIDRSSTMLACVPPLPEGWRLERANALRLPVEAASVDVAFALFLLHLMSDRRRAACLRELRRVIADDGRVVIVIPALPRRKLARAAYRVLLAALGHTLAATLQPIDLTGAATAAGFRIEAATPSGRGYPAICLLLRPIEAL